MATDLETPHIRTTPLISGPIVSPSDSAIDSAIDQAGSAAEHPNINGPSLMRVPDWVVRPLARYYLYYADHKGTGSISRLRTTLPDPGRTTSPARFISVTHPSCNRRQKSPRTWTAMRWRCRGPKTYRVCSMIASFRISLHPK
jgi:hypothetical protein